MKTVATLLAGLAVPAFFAPAASAQYATGFEAPAFVSGTINGQASWTSTSPANARVLTATEIDDALTTAGLTPGLPVKGGSQALFVSGAGSSSATIRPISGLSTERYVVLDVWARPLAPGTTTAPIGNVFLTLEDSAGNRAAAFRFGYVNSQYRIDYGTTVTGIWQASGVAWNSDSWYHLTLSADYATKTYGFDIDGVRVNTSPIPFYSATSANFSQVRIFRGSNQAGMIVDNLSVVPEPGALALLLLGGCGLLFRRK